MFKKIKQLVLQNTEWGKKRYLNYLYKYDMDKFFASSCMNEKNIEAIATEIRILSHTIEKGMSLQSCKVGFGKDKITKLMELCERYERQDNVKDLEAIYIAKSTISAYVNFQNKHGANTEFIPQDYRNALEKEAGVMLCNEKETIAKNRHSCRYYSKKKVESAVIREVVKLSQTAPSACNRQSIHVFACTSEKDKQKILDMHGGVRGFGMPGVIFAVTGDLGLYLNEFERNTVFVDGGIFVMNMLYSLESFGLVACPIIWGGEPDMDGKLSNILSIPTSHKIVSLIMAGYAPEKKYKVAVSPKRDVETVLHLK